MVCPLSSLIVAQGRGHRPHPRTRAFTRLTVTSPLQESPMKNRLTLAAGTVLAAALALTGCSSGAQSSKDSSAPASASASQSPTSRPSASYSALPTTWSPRS